MTPFSLAKHQSQDETLTSLPFRSHATCRCSFASSLNTLLQTFPSRPLLIVSVRSASYEQNASNSPTGSMSSDTMGPPLCSYSNKRRGSSSLVMSMSWMVPHSPPHASKFPVCHTMKSG
jgi:hypothetical protein